MMDDEVPKISMFEPYGADTAKPDQDTQKAPGFEALVALQGLGIKSLTNQNLYVTAKENIRQGLPENESLLNMTEKSVFSGCSIFESPVEPEQAKTINNIVINNYNGPA